MTLHMNLIDGEWVKGEAVPEPQPVQRQGGGRRVRPRHRRGRRSARSPRPRRRSRPGRARGRWSGTACCARPPTRSSRARRSSAGCLSREEGKTLAEGIGETVRAGADLRLLRRRGLRLAGETRALGAARRRRRDDARGGRRGRADHAVELPDRHPGLEDRAGARLRQHRGASSRPTWCRAAPGRSSTSCTAPACRRACSTSSWARARWSARRSSTARTSSAISFTGSQGDRHARRRGERQA